MFEGCRIRTSSEIANVLRGVWFPVISICSIAFIAVWSLALLIYMAGPDQRPAPFWLTAEQAYLCGTITFAIEGVLLAIFILYKTIVTERD